MFDIKCQSILHFAGLPPIGCGQIGQELFVFFGNPTIGYLHLVIIDGEEFFPLLFLISFQMEALNAILNA